MKTAFATLLALCSLLSQAQTTFVLTAVPASTPAGATIYMAGDFNGWNPGSPTHAFTFDAVAGNYTLTLPASVTGPIQYKFTRGSWTSVETGAANASLPNRRYTIGSTAGPVPHQILNWSDLYGRTSTATANVSILSASFAMPQLGRARRVWLYLPNDYATSTRRYPVLYLQDGQNVFDDATSFAGEWGVDETLRQLQASGLDPTGCIVVAVDNGPNRLDEYSPWNNPAYGGGQGDLYVDFLTQTLKPYIDANYRTLPGREHTGVAGSSMGALIATYAAVRYPAVFGKVGALSPAYWFARPQLMQYLHQHPANPDTRFYFVGGINESASMAADMVAVRDSLQRGGVPASRLNLNLQSDGQHAEWFWRREFGPAYQWLYGAALPTATAVAIQPLAFSLFPNPSTDFVWVQLPAQVAAAQVQVLDATGRTVLRTAVRHGQPLNLSQLSKGLYLVRAVAGPQAGSRRLLRE